MKSNEADCECPLYNSDWQQCIDAAEREQKMKKRMIERGRGLVMVGLLVAASLGNFGQLLQIKAAEMEHQTLKLEQKAQWMDQENGKGMITLEVSGLLAYKEQVRTETVPKGEENQGKIEEMVCMKSNAAENVVFMNCGMEAGYADTESAEMIAYGEEFAEEETVKEDIDEDTGGDSAGSSEGVIQSSEDLADSGSMDTNGEVNMNANANTNADANANTNANMDADANMNTDVSSDIKDDTNTDINIEPGAESSSEPEKASKNLLRVVDYISEYFDLDNEMLEKENLAKEYQTELLPILNQNGVETTITKVIREVSIEEVTEDTMKMNIPIVLRKEYQVNEKNTIYPVSQDEPLQKGENGAGAYIQELAENEWEKLLQVKTASLEIEAAKADFDINLRLITAAPKAGERILYELDLTNTGLLPLTELSFSSKTCKDIAGQWEVADGLEVNGGTARLSGLAVGETRTFQISVPLTEDCSGNLRHTVSAETDIPGTEGESMKQEVTVDTEVAALKAEFTVEKTADRTEALPGDTIMYQICIRNTGERTLHSVLSTERFLNAGVQAQFVEKEGVILNGSKTQALIAQILPGEAFALQAQVTIPQNFASQELINQVQVVTKETGNQTIQSQASVNVQPQTPTATPTIMMNQSSTYQSGYGTKSSGTGAYSTATQPKTGDDSAAGLFVVLLCCCGFSIPGILWHWKGKSKH